MIAKILFLLVLIAVNAFFAASEIALISLNDNKIKVMAEAGNKKAKKLAVLLGKPSRFLATIQIGITFAGFLASAFAAETFADPLVQLLIAYNFPLSESSLKVVTVIAITIVLSYFTLVFGELVPKRVAMNKSDQIAFFVVTPLTVLSKVANPFVKTLTASTNFFVRLFGIDPHAIEAGVTEEEIRMMVDVGEEKGAINKREKIMINKVFEFNNKTVEDIMTHRMEIFGIPANIDLKNLIEIINERHYSRIPVYDESIDNIIGILHVKDLLTLICVDEKKPFSLEAFIRKPLFVPMQKKIDEIFSNLQRANTHIAIALDEYGGTAGIVTIEDLVEEIVGNIFDEYDRDEDKEIKKIDEVTFEVSGIISLDEFEDYFDVKLTTGDYDTLNGFLISKLGSIPPKGELSELRIMHLLIQVTEVTDKRIVKVIVIIDNQ